MNRRWLIVAIMLVAALVGIGYLVNRPKPVSVEFATATRGAIEQTIVNTRAGTVIACRRAELSPATGGVVTTLGVKKGDRVKQGALLLQLWNADARAELELTQMDFISSQSQAEEACTIADWAERDAKRLQRLHGKAVISEEDVDRATAEAQSKRARCNSAKTTVNVSQKRIDVARATLERTQLIAPYDGIVAETNAELGEYVTPSPPGIATRPPIDLIDDSCLFIRAPIDETDAAAARVGQTARITLDALPGKSFMGKVSRIAPYILDREKQARTVDVEVQFDNPAESIGLLVGYSADIEIILQSHADVVRLPTNAIDDGKAVWLYNSATGTAYRQAIAQGIRNWTLTEITSGIKAGDVVIVAPNKKLLHDGALVKQKEAETDAETP